MSADFVVGKSTRRPAIAILGVPFDNVTKAEAVELIEEMICSGQPHYLVTPNVDFLVQARRDTELRRILFEAHLVLCDGTPLVWISRLLGNALPERVAGSDLVPLLLHTAAQKGYRLFLLGATAESAARAVSRLKQQHPGLLIAGHYSPPFNQLLEMDHEEIKRRILRAKPDLLFVSFGCPKQEKWVAMHYRHLGVPVTAGVGATIDFLAGQYRRAPVWMQRSGTEWIFRLAQEPRRLFKRYFADFWIFGSSIFPQWWKLRVRTRTRPSPHLVSPSKRAQGLHDNSVYRVRLPQRLDVIAVSESASWHDPANAFNKHCILEGEATTFIDSTGVGWLIRLQKRLRSAGRQLVLLTPSLAVLRALNLMKLTEFFQVATDESEAQRYLCAADGDTREMVTSVTESDVAKLNWHGEVTAANAESVWQRTQGYLKEATPATKTIDLSQVRFIDSSGLGLMIRAKKRSLERGESLRFIGLQPPVRNVIELSRLEDFLLGRQVPKDSRTLSRAE